MKRILTRLVGMTLILALILSVTSGASGLISDISGKQNKGIVVKLNGITQTLKDGNGNTVYPVVINGTTYLPIRAVSALANMGITWDAATTTINLTSTSDEGAVPTDLPPTVNNGNTTPVAPPSTSSNSTAGTKTSPLYVGSSTTRSVKGVEHFGDDSLSYDMSLKVDAVERIQDSYIDENSEYHESSEGIDYYLMTVTIKMSNISYVNSEDPTDYIYLENTLPSVRETYNAKSYVSGALDYDFPGSLGSVISKQLDFKKLVSGNKDNGYTVTGKIIVGCSEGTTLNTVLIEPLGTSKYDDPEMMIHIRIN